MSLQVTISLFSEVLFSCCLLTDWALVLMVQCTVWVFSVMQVHFTVYLFDIVSHHFTFLCGPLLMLSSYWLSSGPYGTMFSISVQCNASKFYSLFVLLFIFSNSNSKLNLLQYQKEGPKLHFELFIVQLNTFGYSNIRQIIIQSSQLYHI